MKIGSIRLSAALALTLPMATAQTAAAAEEAASIPPAASAPAPAPDQESATAPAAATQPPIPTPEQLERVRKGRGGLDLHRPAGTLTDRQEEALSAQDDVDIIHYFLDLNFDTTRISSWTRPRR